MLYRESEPCGEVRCRATRLAPRRCGACLFPRPGSAGSWLHRFELPPLVGIYGWFVGRGGRNHAGWAGKACVLPENVHIGGEFCFGGISRGSARAGGARGYCGEEGERGVSGDGLSGFLQGMASRGSGGRSSWIGRRLAPVRGCPVWRFSGGGCAAIAGRYFSRFGRAPSGSRPRRDRHQRAVRCGVGREARRLGRDGRGGEAGSRAERGGRGGDVPVSDSSSASNVRP